MEELLHGAPARFANGRPGAWQHMHIHV